MSNTPQRGYEPLAQNEGRKYPVVVENSFDTVNTQYKLGHTVSNPGAFTVDRAGGTRKACLAGLILSTLCGVAAIVVGIVSKGSQQTWDLSPAARKLWILPINIFLLAITESLGYIHAISLRWALFHEGRLDFNTNLRLMTFARQSGPNNAFFSIIFFICIATVYAAGNMLLVYNTSAFYMARLSGDEGPDWDTEKRNASIPRSIPICLGVAILMMCAITAWSIKRSRISSWSSDPFTTVSVALNSTLVHRKGRAMMSVRDRKLSSRASKPVSRQPAVRSASKMVKWVLLLNVAVLITLAIWTAVIVYVGYHGSGTRHDNGSSWGFFPTATANNNYINGLRGSDFENESDATLTVFLFFFASAGMGDLGTLDEGRMIGVLLLYLAIQSIVTIGLHCAELQCQLVRDEATWRTLESPNGQPQPSTYNSVMQPFLSWQGAGLMFFKVVTHWIFGASLQVDYSQGLLMRPPQITYLTITWLFFVVFIVAVTMTSPKGYLPASYGHLQTMADVADEWWDKMYWGDKNLAESQDGLRHAGTSQMELPPVHEEDLYA
ncbi:hypothetical protein LTR70_005327 [Exophiala xenobiotica]|uniref:Uncharacterized protein n=1 Tax=Lithohypha guttulata TaxID=1690604 RepID=A0ABR0K5P3_9EURO|nr:hypothetical protein LTR24_006657 [Lithohypha guttulata]KAK5318762.1 hypothetical protein LTR70_005327 [Exophiala xenobiotica]